MQAHACIRSLDLEPNTLDLQPSSGEGVNDAKVPAKNALA
jgi:hypothetical protein